MKTDSSFSEKIAVIALFVAAVGWRLVTGFSGDTNWLPNFAPLAAIALCGAIYFPKRVALVLPLAALFASDLVLNIFRYGVTPLSLEMVARYLALALAGGIGLLLRARPRFALVMLGSVASSVIFYALTNAVSWLSNPGYAKNFGGLVQSLTVGLPGRPPSWMFFRNTLVSDLLFSALFMACIAATRERVFTLPVKQVAASR